MFLIRNEDKFLIAIFKLWIINILTINVIIYFRSIKRIIFYSLIKASMNEKGEREMDTISVSSALQIAGRAGRWVEFY